MNCEQIIQLIQAAQADMEMHELPEGLTEWPVLTVACRAFSFVLPGKRKSFESSINDLLDMCLMLELMRRGEDPRCNDCLAREKICEFSFRRHRMRSREVVQ